MGLSPTGASSSARLAGLTLGLVTLGLAARAPDAHADDPQPMVLSAPPTTGEVAPAVPGSGKTPPPSRPVTRKPIAPPKPSLPVEMTIVAASPDPPWTLRIVNVGDHPIRIAADSRLLTFELDATTKNGAKVKCAAPAGLRPQSFPSARELYLDPGEAYVEDFDPRLYCFGEKIDLLSGGTNVHAHLGWPKESRRANGPFAAQGTDRPEAFAPLTELSAPTIQLSYAAYAPMAPAAGQSDPAANADTAAPSIAPTLPSAAAAPAAKASNAKPDALGGTPTNRPGEADKNGDSAADLGQSQEDRNAAHVDVYVSRTSDADAPRNVVVNIRAVNEGRRELISALRGRMLSFTVEELGPDNKPRQSFVCSGSERPHATPTEAGRDLDAGQAVTIPIILAEICPRETFDRPGLYRVRPRIDTNLEGEMLKQHPYIGKALARQSSLVRVATSRKPFQDQAPKAYVAPAQSGPSAAR